MENRTYIKFVLMALTALMLFSVGGYLFYGSVSRYFTVEVEREQAMVADRIVDNLQAYLQRVRQTVDSVIDFTPHQAGGIKEFIAHRFKLLWEIYPEIFHLAFLAADGEVYYTGEDGDFMPLGLPLQEVYEWQYFDSSSWGEIDDDELHQQLSVLMYYVPELGKVMPVPIIIFAKRIIIDGEYLGLMLVPYQFDFMINNYCRSLVVDGRREIVVADNRGQVVFSSLPGLLLREFYPTYGLSPDLLLERSQKVSLLDKDELPLVLAAIANQNPFSTTMQTFSGDRNRDFLATFQAMEMVVPGWTVMVATPRKKADELAWRLLLPVILLCALLLLLIALFSFFMFRRLDLFAQENAIFKAGLASSSDGVVVLDAQGRYLFINRAYSEITGESSQDKLGTLFEGRSEGGGLPGLPKDIFTILSMRGNWQDVVSYGNVGEKGNVEVSQNFSEIYRAGRKVGYISNLHDISEERRLKREVEVYSAFLHKEVARQTEVILQSQKMETVGILAAGFAHDFNNLLASMHGNIELLEMVLKSSPPRVVRYIANLKQISTQAADLTRQILLFSRRDKGATEIMTVAELIESVMVLVSPSLPAQISFDCFEDSCDLKLEVDKAAMVQSIFNLVLNAGESFVENHDNARIRIFAKAKFVDSYLAQRLNLISGNWYCELTVSDNGVGIAPAMMSKIFDPFFSTKEWTNQKGTGLGLAIAYRTIANHDGIITVTSELGVGSSFVISLPVASNVDKCLPSVEPEWEASHDLKGRKILVVEDEELLRESLKVLLELYGARVESASDGREALEILETVSVDLIVLDLVMSEMGGEEFLSEMEERKIKIPVLIMTGTVNEGFRVSRNFPVVMDVLEKPFPQKQLLQLCAQLLS